MPMDTPQDTLIATVPHQSTLVHIPTVALTAITLGEHYLANTGFLLQPLHPPLLPLFSLALRFPLPQCVQSCRREGHADSGELREGSVPGVGDGWEFHLVAAAEGLQVLLVLLYGLVDELKVFLRTNCPLNFIIHAHRL